MAINQCISWWCFAGKGVDDVTLLREVKRIGFKAAELVPADKLHLVKEAGLEIGSIGGHQSISSGFNDPSQHDRIEGEILANLEVAKKFGIPNLICLSGDRRPGLSDEEGIENSIVGLQRVAKAAETAGVNLVMELLNSKVDHKGYQCDKTSWGIEVIDGVGSPRVKLLYDIYHMQIMEGDIIRTIRESHSYFGHYHTAGNPGRRDMDESQELFYPPIMRAISDTGYTGYVGHEFTPKGDVIKALEYTYKLCNV